MQFILCNIETTNSLTDQLLYNNILKVFAYNAKLKTKNLFQYLMVAIPHELQYFNNNEEKEMNTFQNTIKGKLNDKYELFSLYKVFKDVSDISITIINTIDANKLNIFYADGSSSKKISKASYGVTKLLGESNDKNAKFDSFTNTTQLYKTFSGTINDGTNNVGELTGIKTAVENSGRFPIQVIISDSEYSIKAFREWIYNWEKTNYKNYAGKSIANKELIKSIRSNIVNSKKIFLFKWTKGHAGEFFNECCDELAKNELGIEK